MPGQGHDNYPAVGDLYDHLDDDELEDLKEALKKNRSKLSEQVAHIKEALENERS